MKQNGRNLVASTALIGIALSTSVAAQRLAAAEGDRPRSAPSVSASDRAAHVTDVRITLHGEPGRLGAISISARRAQLGTSRSELLVDRFDLSGRIDREVALPLGRHVYVQGTAIRYDGLQLLVEPNTEPHRIEVVMDGRVTSLRIPPIRPYDRVTDRPYVAVPPSPSRLGLFAVADRGRLVIDGNVSTRQLGQYLHGDPAGSASGGGTVGWAGTHQLHELEQHLSARKTKHLPYAGSGPKQAQVSQEPAGATR